jgi:DNA-binding transcriptional LysR family regulator
MSITLRQLEIFIAVAETAQVTKASKKLFVTQSAVSMALAELENQLGGSLFDRHGRSLLLNARGRFLLPLAKDITCQVSNIETIMSERNDTLEGRIEVVASTTLGNYILPYLIGAFKRVHPNVYVNMLVYNTRYAEKLVFDNEMDVGFVEGPVGREDLMWRPWFEDELIVLCGPTDPLAHNEVFDIPEAVKRAVESGTGITCLSSLSICREAEHGWLKGLKIEGLDMKRQLRIIQRKDREVSDALAEFLEFCDVMTICDDSGICLSSPWKLQSLLARHSAMKK